MNSFAQLYRQIEEAKTTSGKAAAVTAALGGAAREDAAWIVALLLGQAPARSVSPNDLRALAISAASVPPWLLERCYTAAGDLSETIALLTQQLPGAPMFDAGENHDAFTPPAGAPLSWWMERFLPRLRELSAPEKQAAVITAWRTLDTGGRLVFNKLLIGQLRVRGGRSLVERAVADLTGLSRAVISQRLAALCPITAAGYDLLLSAEVQGDEAPFHGCNGLPYAFQSIESIDDVSSLSCDATDWHAEYLLDGSVRVQLVRHAHCSGIWTSDYENLTKQLPEVADMAQAFPDGTILEGSLTAWNGYENSPGSAMQLKRRLESRVGYESKVKMLVSDLLQIAGRDLRGQPYGERRQQLDRLFETMNLSPIIEIAPALPFTCRADLDAYIDHGRAKRAAGVLLKSKGSRYGSGDGARHWILARAKAQEVTALLLYAEAARGQAASRFTNYTFGVWAAPGGERALIPIGKTSEGLSDSERRQIDRFALQNTLERHGPVRVLRPLLACRLAFDSVEESARHKSGLTLRGARVIRLLPEASPEQIETLETLRGLMPGGLGSEGAVRQDG